MWWLDDNLFRGNSGDRRRFLLRAGLPASSPAAAPRHRFRDLALTPAEEDANRRLLEIDADDKQAELQSLRTDIASLEDAVREQKSQRLDAETKWEQQVAELTRKLAEVTETSEQTVATLRQHHEQEQDRLQQRLAAAEQVADEICEQFDRESAEHRDQLASATESCQQRDDWLRESLHENTLLRQSLAASEQRVRQRDLELCDLSAELDARRREHANEMAELEHRHAVECKYLRTVAWDAERSAAEHRDENIKLLADRTQSRLTQLDEMQSLRQVYAAKREQTQSRLQGAANRILAQRTELKRLTIELEAAGKENETLSRENEEHCRQLANLAAERESADNERHQGEAEHADYVAKMSSKLSALTAKLDRRDSEIVELRVAAARAQARHGATVIDLQRKLRSAQTSARTSAEQAAADASAQCQQISELQGSVEELESNVADLRESLASANAELDEQRVEFQRERTAFFQREWSTISEERLAFRAERRVFAEQRAAAEREIARSKQALASQHELAVDQLRRSLTREWELLVQRNSEKRRADQVRLDAREQQIEYGKHLARLYESLDEQQRQLRLLGSQRDEATQKLDRKNSSLERLRQENERLLEVQDSQYASMQSRLNELIVAFDDERSQRDTAENEARRLSVERSERIAFLSQQREQLLDQVSGMNEENDRLRAERDQSHTRAGAVEKWFRLANEQLIETSNEAQRLRVQAEESLSSPLADDLRVAMSQRDRTITQLETETMKLYARLQREAAARRKAEGAIKRQGKTADVDTVVHEAWHEIDVRDQVERLQGQVNALRNLNRFERQKFLTELARSKQEVERLQRQPGNRAA